VGVKLVNFSKERTMKTRVKNWIGRIMIAMIAIGLFTAIAIDIGVWKALLIVGGVIGMFAWIVIAAYLIYERD
jgi:uncharacterized membrane protein